jgi:hypothetical protein
MYFSGLFQTFILSYPSIIMFSPPTGIKNIFITDNIPLRIKSPLFEFSPKDVTFK